MRKLIVTDGRRERELLLVGKIVVGRDPTCDLSEADPLLSRRHAEFAISGDDIVVRDLGSRNGIYVNGARIAEGTLQSGDVVRIGRLQMRYVEDTAPLVAVPELADDATGFVFSGPRAAAGTPPPPVAKPAPAPAEPDGDATSYVPASGSKRAPTGVAAGSSAKIPPPRPVTPFGSRTQPAPPPGDEAQQTRVVPPPKFRTSVQPPPAPPADVPDEPTSFIAPRPRTAVQQAPPLGDRTAVQPPPAPPTEVPDEPTSFIAPRPRTAVQPAPPHPSAPVEFTAVKPPPAPPAEDQDEPTSVILARPRTGVQARPGDAASGDAARQARAVASAVEAIASFLDGAPIGRAAAAAVKTLERDLTNAPPPADLVKGLKTLAARLSEAANDLT